MISFPAMAVTMQDIARGLDVSVVTVSKVLRNKGKISAATRKRYRGWVIRFIDDCAVPLGDANEAHVEAFLRAPQVMQRQRTVPAPAPAERAEAVEAFRTFFAWTRASAVR